MAIRVSDLRNRAAVEIGVHSTLPFRSCVLLNPMAGGPFRRNWQLVRKGVRIDVHLMAPKKRQNLLPATACRFESGLGHQPSRAPRLNALSPKSRRTLPRVLVGHWYDRSRSLDLSPSVAALVRT
jgi:hypothetical protein